MQIVIDINVGVYCLLKYFEKALGLNDKKGSNDDVKTALMRAVVNGTQLPKGHGVLKDADAICKDIISALGIRDENYLLEAEEAVYKRIKNAPTIIEADRAESEDKE